MSCSTPILSYCIDVLNNTKPSSEVIVFSIDKAYYHRLTLRRKSCITFPHIPEDKVHIVLALKSCIEEVQNRNSAPYIDIASSMRRLLINRLQAIHCHIRMSISKKQKKKLEKIEPILRWINSQGSNDYPFVREKTVEALLRLGFWTEGKDFSVETRETLVETVKLLMVKDKEWYGA